MNEDRTKDAEETQGIKRQWTPGPLEFRSAQQDPYPNTRAGIKKFVGDCWDDTPEGGRWGALFSAENSITCVFGNGPTTKANATLYAAAPELFEALKTLADAVAGHSDWLNWKLELDQAEAALAKAIGGQP